MTVKLHHCSWTWLKVPVHPCHNVRKALDEQGIEYELVTHPVLPRSKRTAVVELSGQQLLPVIELDDGTVIRQESKEMIARIKAGDLSS